MKSKETQLTALKKVMAKKNLLLKDTATNLVFGNGDANASVLFVGEAPGKNEDLQGLPFVGSAGKILNELLHSIGLDTKDVYITSILKYRPPKNRNPSLKEIIDHTPFLIEQIKIIKPKIIVTLGNFSTRFVLSGFDIEQMSKVPGISQLHGKVKLMNYNNEHFAVMPMFHPAAILYNRSLHKTLKKDFIMIKKYLIQINRK